MCQAYQTAVCRKLKIYKYNNENIWNISVENYSKTIYIYVIINMNCTTIF